MQAKRNRARSYPAPLIQATGVLHLCGVAALALGRMDWHWVAGTLLANHGVVFAASVVPRSRLLGPNIVRLPEAAAEKRHVALTFDDGPDPEVTPRVLDLLDRHHAVASFFCIGERAAAHPQLVREIVARGHAVENHGHRHGYAFSFQGPRRMRSEIAAAQRAIADAGGVAPAFFRAPYGVRSPLLDRVLGDLGLRYVSWRWRGFDAVDRDAARVLRRLTKKVAAGDVLLLHDGNTLSRRAQDSTALRVLPSLLERLDDLGLRSVSLASAFGLAGRD